jgi:hypothetical protein
MRTGISAVVLAGTAVLAAGPAVAPPAAAIANAWTIRPGGTITATAGKTTLTDVSAGSVVPCVSSRMTGTLKPGSGLAGAGIGSVATAAYDRCGVALFTLRLTPRGLPWRLNLTSYDAHSGAARGTISGLRLVFSSPEIPCAAVINGTSSTAADGVVAVSYANKTGTLRVLPGGGNLHWYHVRSCARVVRTGDPATLSASYSISPRQAITSP